MNMLFLKLIGTIILLLSCSSGYSFSHPDNFEKVEKQIFVSAELEEGIYYFSDSTLTTTSGFTQLKLADSSVPDFHLYSLHEVRHSGIYLKYSAFIQPALDISGIIFPFHFFL